MDVVETGKGRARVVAVHGIQGTRAAWAPLVAQLGEDATFVLPNLRGRAAALRGGCVDDYRLERLGDDLQEVIHAYAGSGDFYLAGWSMGVSVALEYLSRPDVPRPVGVILMSGTPSLDEVQWFANEGAALVEEIAERERRLGLVEAADRDAVAWTWEAISSTNQTAMLPGIDIPVLIIHGRDDEDSPFAHATRLADALPRATLCTLEGVGHTVLKDATTRVAEEVRAFISRNQKH